MYLAFLSSAYLCDITLMFMTLLILFHVSASFFSDTKRLSWVLTTVASLTMTIASIPFLWDYFASGGSLKHVRALPKLAVVMSRFFQTYLVSDIVLGSIYYRSNITLLMGWIHHPLYVVIVELAIQRSWSHFFCLAASMELPTLILGIATLFPQLRSDILFVVCFFMTRILFHIVLGVSFLFEENRNSLTGGSYVPAMLFAGVLPVHLTWFMRCIKGFVRRGRKTTPVSHSAFVGGDLVLEPSLSPSKVQSTKPYLEVSSVSSTVSAPLHRFRRRLSYNHQIQMWALRSLQYYAVAPNSRLMSFPNVISPSYEWLSQRYIATAMVATYRAVMDDVSITSESQELLHINPTLYDKRL